MPKPSRMTQRRRRRSGWSGLGRTTFQRVVGLVPRLQRRSEDETIGPGVPRKLTFAVRVRVSRNRSRSFTGGSGARRGPTGLHRHPRVAKYTCVYDVQLLADMAHSAACSSSASQPSPTRRPFAETPHAPASVFSYDRLERRTLCTGLFSQVGLLLGCTIACCRPPHPRSHA